MFLLRPPSQAHVEHFLLEQRRAPYSYLEVGATRNSDPSPGYTLDSHRVRLGEGQPCFDRACRALREWQMFGTDFVQLLTPDARFAAGETLVLRVKHFGFYSLIANRVVYLVEEPGRFGFGYGTLTGHAEQGEERFLVTLDPAGGVHFELYAFSRPRHLLAILGTPVVRWLQRAAARSYSAAMVRAVSG